MKKTLYFLCIVGALFAFSGSAFAQSARHWEIAKGDFNIPKNQLMLGQLPEAYKFAVLDVPALYQELSTTASSDASPLRISIPTPEGNFAEFFITETSVISPEAAPLYTIKTFKGYAKNAQQVTIRCDISPTGFHAAIFHGDITYVVEPVSKGNVSQHIAYYKSDLHVPGLKCGVNDTHRIDGYKPSPEDETPKTPTNLRTYRLAIIADATYRAQYGGMPYNATNVLNSFASGMNMVNAVYERDLGVHLSLVSNAACADAVLADHTNLGQVHAFIVNNSGLGSGGFDVGHSLLWSNTGGVASLGVVCNNSFKGRGFSGAAGSFTQLYVDYMAHELGHQFGAEHTFASSECGNSVTNFRYETGEGSTIMAYAGVCGTEPSYQNFSDPYFHAASIAQINTYISSGGTCAAISTPGSGNNAAPTANAQSDITIPKQTPFILVGNGTDANSDPVSFSWEQYDGTGAATTGSPNCTYTNQPLFRFRLPVADNFRVFPQLSDVLAGNNNTPAWEKLPCVARTLNFRLTTRDNNTNWGRTASDNVVVTVANTGPFDVTAPNGGQTWEGNSTQSVTWTVNGTDSHCANVDVLVSTDNGVTFTLIGTFPNNGTASITVPNTPSTSARVLVQCSVGGNFRSASTFFDVSNAVFTIEEEGCGSAYWNMETASSASNSIDNTTFGNITQGNNNGTTMLLTSVSTSSGYTGASGANNAGAAARTGVLNTAANGSAYFEIVATPNANTIFTLNGISFGSRSTGTGPLAYSIRTSADNYATQVAGGTLLSNSTWALKSNTGLSVASGAGTPITIRIYGHSGTGSPGANTANWRIDDLTITGCNDPVVVCPTLTTPGEVQITNSTCTANCTVTGGNISAPTVGCPMGSTLQYNVNGDGWSTNLPAYNTNGPAQTIQTRCSCDADPNTVSTASTGVTTVPGTCTTPAAPTGTLAIVNSTCTNCAVSGGSIAIGTVSGTGGTLQYSTDGGTTWNAALPTYNQTGPAQTILASVLSANGCRSNTTQVGQTTPGTCTTPSTPTGILAIVNSTCNNCVVSGGSIAIGTVSGTGGTLQYSTDGGTTWNAALPVYNQTGPAQTILASVLGANGCRSGNITVGTTSPGNCDNQVLTTYYVDADGDGFGTGQGQLFCSNPGPGFSLQAGDCNDNAPGINPAAVEVCDGIDNNCNGTIDDVDGNTSGNWNSANVGQANGSSNFPPCGSDQDDVFNLSATGFSTSSSDNLHAVYQELCGNGEIIARVLSVSSGGWAGITLRETLMPGSKKVALKTQLTSIIRREIRTVTNGAASILNFNRPAHVWLRLVRNGGNFTGYTSVNGVNWDFAFTATISMGGCIYAGLFAESINNNVETNVSFDNVTILGGTPLLGATTQPVVALDGLSVSVYPNPGSGDMTLSVTGAPERNLQLEVTNALGRIVRNIALPEGAVFTYPLDLSSEPAGVYYLRLRSENGVESVQRVVVQE